MTIGEVTEILARFKGTATSKTLSKIKEILALAREQEFWGSQFTFDADADLDDSVNNMLIQLTDELIAEIDRLALEVSNNDSDAIPYLHRKINGMDLTVRLDSHASHLKYLLEGYFAVCFASKMNDGQIMGDVLRFLANPDAYAPMKDAYAHYQDYRSGMIWGRGYHFGKGVARNPIDGFVLTGRGGITDAFHKGTVDSFKERGITAYHVYRGSNYPCPLCDDVCFDSNGRRRVYYTEGDIPVPVHPNCVCYIVPIEKGEE